MGKEFYQGDRMRRDFEAEEYRAYLEEIDVFH